MMTVARPRAVDSWPVEKVAGVECLFDRGIPTVRISHETGYPQTVIRDFRDWYSRNGQLWPGPREVAIALRVACAFTDENPADVLTTPGTSRGRAYAFWALRRAYPGLPRVTLARMLGCRPFGTTTDRYVEGFVNRFSMDRPADYWWSPDNAQAVAAELSQKPTYGPLPSWFGARDKKLAADYQPPMPTPRAKVDPLPEAKLEPWRSSHPTPGPRPAPAPPPPVVQPEPTVQPAVAPVVVARATVEEKPMRQAAAAVVPPAGDDDEPVAPPPAPVLRTLGGHAALGIVGTFDPDQLTGCARAVRDIRFGECRWPLGEVGADDFRFCCEAVREGSPYCSAHASTAKGQPGKWVRLWR